MKNLSRCLIAGCLLIVVTSSGCAAGPWFNPNPVGGMAGGAAPRRGLFPNLRNRIRDAWPGSSAPEQYPVQQASDYQPGPSSDAPSITIGDE